MANLDSVWAQREEVIYPELFGEVERGIFPLGIDLFANWKADPDPRWLHHGVFEFAPTSARATWLYVTSGTSNPWDIEPADFDPEEYSGIGTELVLEAPAQADWAVSALQRLLAYNLLLVHGRLGEPRALDYGARVPLGGPINGDSSSQLLYVAIGKPGHYPCSFSLDSGIVDFLHLVGITEQERDLAKSTSTAELLSLLQAGGAYPHTDPSRMSIV